MVLIMEGGREGYMAFEFYRKLLLESNVHTEEELDEMDDLQIQVDFFEHFHIFATTHVIKDQVQYYYILKSAMSELMSENKAYKGTSI